MKPGERMSKAARDHIRAKQKAHWTPDRRKAASEQTKRDWDRRRADERDRLDGEDHRVLVELQRREDAVLTRSQAERAVRILDGQLLDRILHRLADRELLVINRRGGQDMISLTLRGRSFREG